MVTKSTKPTKHQMAAAYRAIRRIHDILYRELKPGEAGEAFYNGNKEWDVAMLDDIAETVEAVILRPAAVEVCIECSALPGSRRRLRWQVPGLREQSEMITSDKACVESGRQ